MEKQNPYPLWGKKVRLTQDYQIVDHLGLGIMAGDELNVSDGKMEVKHIATDRSQPIIPIGTIGTIGEGPYCGGICDYEVECPVRFNIEDPNVPGTLGTPWELIELV